MFAGNPDAERSTTGSAAEALPPELCAHALGLTAFPRASYIAASLSASLRHRDILKEAPWPGSSRPSTFLLYCASLRGRRAGPRKKSRRGGVAQLVRAAES